MALSPNQLLARQRNRHLGPSAPRLDPLQNDDTERRIRETVAYIDDAQTLATR